MTPAHPPDLLRRAPGPGVDADRTYYRVVAVDSQGKRSGPRDYAAAPRPTITGTPVTRAKVGTEYRCQRRADRSLGDVRLRVVDGKETADCWDGEKPRFAIEAGPAWLKIDPAAGQLSGTPDAAGKVDVTVTSTAVGLRLSFGHVGSNDRSGSSSPRRNEP